MKELESEASGLQRTVESLWKRLEAPLEDQQKVLEAVESFRLRDIEVVSGPVLCMQPQHRLFIVERRVAATGENEEGTYENFYP